MSSKMSCRLVPKWREDSKMQRDPAWHLTGHWIVFLIRCQAGSLCILLSSRMSSNDAVNGDSFIEKLGFDVVSVLHKNPSLFFSFIERKVCNIFWQKWGQQVFLQEAFLLKIDLELGATFLGAQYVKTALKPLAYRKHAFYVTCNTPVLVINHIDSFNSLLDFCLQIRSREIGSMSLAVHFNILDSVYSECFIVVHLLSQVFLLPISFNWSCHLTSWKHGCKPRGWADDCGLSVDSPFF